MLKLYENIKRLRLEKGMTQDELARRAGYTDRSSIAKIERGSVDLSQSKIKQFADIFGVSPSHLMGWVDEETARKNDILTELIVRMRADSDFMDTVAKLSKLSGKRYQSVIDLIDAFDE